MERYGGGNRKLRTFFASRRSGLGFNSTTGSMIIECHFNKYRIYFYIFLTHTKNIQNYLLSREHLFLPCNFRNSSKGIRLPVQIRLSYICIFLINQIQRTGQAIEQCTGFFSSDTLLLITHNQIHINDMMKTGIGMKAFFLTCSNTP